MPQTDGVGDDGGSSVGFLLAEQPPVEAVGAEEVRQELLQVALLDWVDCDWVDGWVGG